MLVDFACKTFDVDDVIRCSLQLTKTELRILRYLLSVDEFVTAKDLSEVLGVDLSTVQRGLKKLFEKDVLFRRQVNLDSGGYVFNYKLKDKDEVKRVIIGIVREWVVRVENIIRSL